MPPYKTYKNNMNVDTNISNLILESLAAGANNFSNAEYAVGPDGKVYRTKDIINWVDYAISLLSKVDYDIASKYLSKLPIYYGFSVDTMATDGKRILINPGFVQWLLDALGGKNPTGIAFVLMHEIYHNLFMHMAREQAQKDKYPNHELANCAQDYEINYVIANHNMIKGKDGSLKNAFNPETVQKINGLYDERFKDNTWEEIYDILEAEGYTPNKKDPPPPPPTQKIPTSDDWKRGYKDGYEKAMQELRAQGLIESTAAVLSNIAIRLYESSATVPTSNDYNAGFDEGYEAVMRAIEQLKSGGSGGGGGGSLPPMPQKDFPNDLPGIKPKFPMSPQEDDNNSGGASGGIKIELPKDQQNNKQNGSSAGSDSQSTNSAGSDSSGETSSDSQSGQSGQSGQSAGQGNSNGNRSGNSSNQSGQGNSDETPSTPNSNQTGGEGDDMGQDHDSNDIQDGNTIGGDSSLKNGISKVYNANPQTSKTGNPEYDKGNHIIDSAIMDDLLAQAGYNPEDTNRENVFDGDEVVETLKKTFGGSMSGKGYGKMMEKILKQIDEIMHPLVDWKEVLKKFMKGAIGSTERIWSKKEMLRGNYKRNRNIPKLDAAKRLIIFIDTSGSMGDALVNAAVNEMTNLAYECKYKYIDVYGFGSYLSDKEEISLSDAKQLKNHHLSIKLGDGGGSTNYDLIFGGKTGKPVGAINELYIARNVPFSTVIVLTDDGISQLHYEIPEYCTWQKKLVWCVMTNEKWMDVEQVQQNIPYGKIVHIPEETIMKNMKISESKTPINRPKRRLLNTYLNEWKKINEDFDDIDDDTDDDTDDDIQAEINRGMTSTEMFQKNLKDWTEYLRAVGILEEYIQLDPETHRIDITGGNNKLIRFDKNAMYKLCDLANADNMINLGKIYRSAAFGYAPRVTALPDVMPSEIVGNLIISGMPRLVDVSNFPKHITGSLIIAACPKLDLFATLPTDVVIDGTILSDMPGQTYENYVKHINGEALSENLNEAFESSILRRLFNKPANKYAAKSLDSIDVYWDKIPDSQINVISPETPGFSKQKRTSIGSAVWGKIYTNFVDNREDDGQGLLIICDKADTIQMIYTKWGPSQGTVYRSFYVASDVYDAIVERRQIVLDSLCEIGALESRGNGHYSTLVRGINTAMRNELMEVPAMKELQDKYEINLPVGSGHVLDWIFKHPAETLKMSDISYHFFELIPDYIYAMYYIGNAPVGDNSPINEPAPADDREAAVSTYKGAHRPNMNMDNFSYVDQMRRRGIQRNKRRELNAGRTVDSLSSNDPMVKKYRDILIDPEIVRQLNMGRYTAGTYEKFIERLTNSLLSTKKLVQKRLMTAYDEGKISDHIFDRTMTKIHIIIKNISYEYDTEGRSGIINQLSRISPGKDYGKLDKLNIDVLQDVNIDKYTNGMNSIAEILTGIDIAIKTGDSSYLEAVLRY